MRVNNLNFFFMLNKADNIISFPEMYSTKEADDMEIRLLSFADDLSEKLEEFTEVSSLVRDLIDKCLARAVVLQALHNNGVYVFFKKL